MKRRTLLTRIGSACAVPSVVAAAAAANATAAENDGVGPADDEADVCVTPLQDNDCMLCCCGGDETCPDKCCFCMCA